MEGALARVGLGQASSLQHPIVCSPHATGHDFARRKLNMSLAEAFRILRNNTVAQASTSQ